MEDIQVANGVPPQGVVVVTLGKNVPLPTSIRPYPLSGSVPGGDHGESDPQVASKGVRGLVVSSSTGCIKGFSEAENYNENGIKTTNFINQNPGIEKCNET